MSDDTSNIRTLNAARAASNTQVQRRAMAPEERIAELEVAMDRLLQQVLQHEKSLKDMDDRQWKLLRLIGKRLGINR